MRVEKDYAALLIGHCCAYILDLEQFLLFSQLALENLNVFLIVHQCQTGLRARVRALNSSSVERFNEGAAIARVRSTSLPTRLSNQPNVAIPEVAIQLLKRRLVPFS